MSRPDPADLRPHPAQAPDAPGLPDQHARPKDRSPDQPADDQQRRPHPQPPASEPPRRPWYKRPWAIVLGVVILIAAAVLVVLWWLHARKYVSTDDAFIDAHVVHVSPQVAGRVSEVLVQDNQHVEAGEPLVKLDPRDFEARVAQAQAAVGEARARLAQAQSQLDVANASVEQSRAEVAVAQANAKNASGELARYKAVAPGAVAQQQLENVTTAANNAAAQLLAAQKRQSAAQAQVVQARAAIEAAQAAVKSAQAALEAAQLQRSYAVIKASVSGQATRRSVEPGDYVQPGQDLFAIVQPDVWVTANFKETDLDQMKVGQPVSIRVDAFSGRDLSGHIDSFQHGSGAAFALLPPENATGNYVKVVQRVPVKIVFDEPQSRLQGLGPGMSVVPKVKVK